jgi:hypothetical protein
VPNGRRRLESCNLILTLRFESFLRINPLRRPCFKSMFKRIYENGKKNIPRKGLIMRKIARNGCRK